MRRVFIIRKDLNLKPGKLAAMTGHLCEAYWTNMIKKSLIDVSQSDKEHIAYTIKVPVDIDKEYLRGIFTKTICECKNKEALHKADNVIKELKLKEGEDWGYINDNCLTDLTPENENGTTTIGMWFRPLPDEQAHMISKKFKLYGIFDK